MPATSEKQRRLMAMALVAKRNHTKPASTKVRKLMDNMTLQQLEEFARKPKKKK